MLILTVKPAVNQIPRYKKCARDSREVEDALTNMRTSTELRGTMISSMDFSVICLMHPDLDSLQAREEELRGPL